MRAARPPYAIVDIGSNSVRLLVYDQLSRAPMPRFNENRCSGSAKAWLRPGGFRPRLSAAVEAVRRFRAIADAMGVTDRRDRDRGDAPRLQRTGAGGGIAAESGLKVRILSGAEEARYATLGVISGFFRPWGWSATWAAAASNWRSDR